MPNAERMPLVDLIAAHLEGWGSPAQFQQLEQLLESSAESRQFYIDHLDMHARLTWERSQVGRAVVLTDWSLQSQQLFNADAPAEQVRVALPKASNWRSWRASHLIGLAASLLLVGYFVALAGLLAWDRFQRGLHRDFVETSAVEPIFATLRSLEDCRWKEDSSAPSLGESFARRSLQLRAGIAEFEFAKGARVIVEGPAELEVRSESEAFLRRGKLMAIVPRQAIGFTVGTPSVTVVDLGTEFGVAVSADGVAHVAVLKGKVNVAPKAHTGQPSVEPRRLVAGETVRVDAQGKVRDGGSSAAFAQLSSRLRLPITSDASAVPDGIRLWLRADQGMELDAEGRVQRWRDQSGKGFDAVQQEPKQRPLFVTKSSQGPGRAAAFDGVDDFLTCDHGLNINTADDMTLFLLLADVREFKSNAGVFILRPRAGKDGSSYDGLLMDLENSRTPAGINTVQGADVPSQEIGWEPIMLYGGFEPRWPLMLVMTKQQGTATLRINGETRAVDSYHFTATGDQLINKAGYAIGSRVGGDCFGGISVAELLIFDRAVTGPQATSIEKQILERHAQPIGDSQTAEDNVVK
jgi:hypothetical protein